MNPSDDSKTQEEKLSAFERLGGEAVLRPLIDRFVDRVFDDLMIGFFFARANRDRVKAKEYEHAAALLGAPVEYSGRPLKEVHQRHAIQGGHFHRRIQILRELLTEQGAPPDIREMWLAHTESQRGEITQSRASECHSSDPQKPKEGK